MNEQLLKMNGLSVEILDVLSFESHLGFPLKKNLHYFDKEKLIAELIAMYYFINCLDTITSILGLTSTPNENGISDPKFWHDDETDCEKIREIQRCSFDCINVYLKYK